MLPYPYSRADQIDKARPEKVELGYPSDDYEAKTLGWPCIGAWAGMAARIVAGSPATVVLVPRGSTLATAGAANVGDR